MNSKFGRFPAIQKGSVGSIMADGRKVVIDEVELEVDGSMTLIQACEEAGIEIPRFCYHERLSIAGNCRMCLVEIVGGPPNYLNQTHSTISCNGKTFMIAES